MMKTHQLIAYWCVNILSNMYYYISVSYVMIGVELSEKTTNKVGFIV